MDWEDDQQDRAPFTEAVDTIADLRHQLENAKLSEGYAMEAVANLHKEVVAELRAERDRLREKVKHLEDFLCKRRKAKNI